jgi:putative transposase
MIARRPPTADAANTVWPVDFEFDATTDGRPVKIVSIVDEHTRVPLRTRRPLDVFTAL